MRTIEDLLRAKGLNVWSIAPDASVYDALVLMAQKNVGALVVMDGENLVGILSERDYARKVILQGKSSKATPVCEIMSAQVVSVRTDQLIEDAMALMSSKRIRHLPVFDGARLIGVISIGDVLKGVLASQRQVYDQMSQLSLSW